jgi:uncharacterized membrane protein YfbV (UPF0208 family)
MDKVGKSSDDGGGEGAEYVNQWPLVTKLIPLNKESRLVDLR